MLKNRTHVLADSVGVMCCRVGCTNCAVTAVDHWHTSVERGVGSTLF